MEIYLLWLILQASRQLHAASAAVCGLQGLLCVEHIAAIQIIKFWIIIVRSLRERKIKIDAHAG